MDKKQLMEMGLTEEQADKVITAHKATLANEFVPKHRFDDVNEQLGIANKTIKERDKQLKTLQDSTEDVEGMKAQIETLTKANAEASKKYEADLELAKVNSALKIQLLADASGKPHDVNMVAGLFDKSLIKLNDNGEIIDGYKAQRETLGKDKAFLFTTPEKPNEPKPGGFKFKGTEPGDGGTPPAENQAKVFGAGLAAKKLGMMGVQPNSKSE